jgi:antitoxin MazE
LIEELRITAAPGDLLVGRTPDILLSDVYPGNQAMQVSKWGNSLAIRLPASVVEALGLKEGDSIEIHAAGRRTFEIEKAPGARELLARLRKFRGRLPKDFKFDRLEANERR